MKLFVFTLGLILSIPLLLASEVSCQQVLSTIEASPSDDLWSFYNFLIQERIIDIDQQHNFYKNLKNGKLINPIPHSKSKFGIVFSSSIFQVHYLLFQKYIDSQQINENYLNIKEIEMKVGELLKIKTVEAAKRETISGDSMLESFFSEYNLGDVKFSKVLLRLTSLLPNGVTPENKDLFDDIMALTMENLKKNNFDHMADEGILLYQMKREYEVDHKEVSAQELINNLNEMMKRGRVDQEKFEMKFGYFKNVNDPRLFELLDLAFTFMPKIFFKGNSIAFNLLTRTNDPVLLRKLMKSNVALSSMEESYLLLAKFKGQETVDCLIDILENLPYKEDERRMFAVGTLFKLGYDASKYIEEIFSIYKLTRNLNSPKISSTFLKIASLDKEFTSNHEDIYLKLLMKYKDFISKEDQAKILGMLKGPETTKLIKAQMEAVMSEDIMSNSEIKNVILSLKGKDEPWALDFIESHLNWRAVARMEAVAEVLSSMKSVRSRELIRVWFIEHPKSVRNGSHQGILEGRSLEDNVYFLKKYVDEYADSSKEYLENFDMVTVMASLRGRESEEAATLCQKIMNMAHTSLYPDALYCLDYLSSIPNEKYYSKILDVLESLNKVHQLVLIHEVLQKVIGHTDKRSIEIMGKFHNVNPFQETAMSGLLYAALVGKISFVEFYHRFPPIEASK